MNINFYHHYFLNYKEKYTIKYITILLILLIVLVMILFVSFSNNKVFKGQVIKNKDRYEVLILLKYEDIKDIKGKCLIDKKEYDCHISKIEKQGNDYLVLLDIKLERKYLIENYPIDVEIKGEKENLYNKITKGWDRWKN